MVIVVGFVLSLLWFAHLGDRSLTRNEYFRSLVAFSILAIVFVVVVKITW